MAEKHQCQQKIYSEGYSVTCGHLCHNNATFQCDGKWYCGTHAPVRKAEKDKARRARWDKEWAEKQRRYELDAAQRKATEGLTLDELSLVTPELIRQALARKSQ